MSQWTVFFFIISVFFLAVQVGSILVSYADQRATVRRASAPLPLDGES